VVVGLSVAGSSHALPEQHAKLMLDQKSVIADFYPKDFAIDMNGARMAWMVSSTTSRGSKKQQEQ
jgi:5'-3' exonuclease